MSKRALWASVYALSLCSGTRPAPAAERKKYRTAGSEENFRAENVLSSLSSARLQACIRFPNPFVGETPKVGNDETPPRFPSVQPNNSVSYGTDAPRARSMFSALVSGSAEILRRRPDGRTDSQ